jgi:DNA (cytosine-5)-methyltransferase 1
MRPNLTTWCPMKPSIFSFFAGAGFLDLGFETNGFEVAYVNEYHLPFLEAYKFSRSKLSIPPPRFGYDSASIEAVDRAKIMAWMQVLHAKGQVVGFIGGPPCPDFSVAGKNRGQHGENGKLSRVYAEMVCEAKPDFFLFENVKGLYRTAQHRKFFEEIKMMFREAGYNLHERLINSIEYGAAQDRDRIILIGFHNECVSGEFEWIGRTFPDRSAFNYSWPSVDQFDTNLTRAAPSNVPLELTVEHWFRRNKVEAHPNAKHCFTPRAGKARFETVSEGDDSRKSYKRLHRWRYSPTAAYGNNEVHLHPYHARRITVAEALAIQSLPAEFQLPPAMTLSNMFKTVGNGVPFLAACGLAKSIRNHLKVSNETYSTELGETDRRPAA